MSVRKQVPVAVVGVSALFPGSTDARGFWNDILAGKDLITDVPPTHWLIEDYYDPNPAAQDKTYAKRGAFLPSVDFDPMEFGLPPSTLPATDSAQILSLIVAQKVLDDASQGQFSKMDRERISVLLGVTSAQELLASMVSRLQKPVWLKALRESGIPEEEAQAICTKMAANYTPWQEASFPGLLGNVVAGRIANRFDLRGTNAVTDAACASSLAAVSMGINELQLGQSDLVITGGVDTMNDIFMYVCFSKTPALSPTGDCRPFSDSADGTMLGEGIAMVALKRLEDAQRDGDRVYAVITGVGSASDGRAKSVYAPLPEGQARALRRAYEVAGYSPETVELVEAHGTGTKAGDVAEFEGLSMAFSESKRADPQWCALGTVKSQIGHTKAAAGAAGLFKAIMALHHKVLPPTIKVDAPNPKLGIEKSPFYLNTQRRPWIRDGAHPRRASVSSFGFGGSNFHVALEEFVPAGEAKRAFRIQTSPTELVLLSAASPKELVTQARALAIAGRELRHVARATQKAFRAGDAARLGLVASDVKDLAEKLEQAIAAIEKSPTTPLSTPTGIHYSNAAGDVGKVAFLFPGQGSQYVGMGADLAMAFDAARSVWDEAAALRFEEQRLHEVVFPKPAFTDAAREAQTKKLTATEWAQPSLGVSSAAAARLLASLGVQPSAVAGHSFGEVTALFAAGAFDVETFVRIARRRGELMRDASAIPGAMTAVGKPIEAVQTVVTESGADVVVANHNAPSQVVLSGSTEAIAKIESALAAKGMTAKRLSVATAFHSPLVAGSSAPFAAFLSEQKMSAPAITVFGNTDAAPYPAKPEAIRERLSTQLAKPVRFVDEIEAMYASGVRTFIEVGAGSVLTDLVGRILGDRPHRAVSVDRKGKHGVTAFFEALARLSVSGLAIDFAPLWADVAPESEKPTKKPAMSLPISGHNYGSPYPPPGGAKALPPPNPPRPAVTVNAAPVAATPSALVSSPSPAMSMVAAAAPSAAVSGEWLTAFQESQRHMADAHAAYQRAMADSHLAFLKASETSLVGLNSVLGGPGAAPTMQPTFAAPTHTPMAAVTTFSAPAPMPVAPAAVVAPPAPRPVPVEVSAAPVVRAAAAPSLDLEGLMMTIVAEKTGYPREMLNATMELEADLGIDSIKRVEILSTMKERAPGLPEVKPAELAALRTLGQIIEHMRAAAGSAAPTGSAPTASTTSTAAAPSLDLEGLMMTIVAEKTGYPREMLTATMELEADLGIDSIKRVEILSTMKERAPGLPEVKPAELAALRTLGQIIEHMRAAGGIAAPVSAPARAASTSTATLDLEGLMMTIVAEKTGYPREMLTATMELEADLGIDSIKRVEILSTMKERAPGLPEVKPAELAALRTLGQIIEHMRASSGAPAPAPAPTHATVTPASAGPALDLEGLMMTIVAEKTGYPREMLTATMELEADLGIDSIKRVEILSTMKERAPGLPEVKPAELAALRTLGQIVEHMRANSGAPASTAAAPSQTQAAASKVDRFAVREVDAPALGMAQAGILHAPRVYVTNDGTPLASAVVAALSKAKVKAELVQTPPADAAAVIFLGGLRAIRNIDDALAISREAFGVAKAVGARFSTDGGVFITVQDTGGDFGLSGKAGQRAWLGGIAALARTAALEWPKASVKAIDLQRAERSAEALAAALVAELLFGGPAIEVGLHADGRRTTLVSDVASLSQPAPTPVGPTSVVVVSGGGRGVTAAALIALAKAAQPRLVLLGRTALTAEDPQLAALSDEGALKKALIQRAQASGKAVTPADIAAEVSRVLANREVQATLSALKAAGSEAKYLAVDVQDAKALGAALDDVRKAWGPITGVVHGAGVLADKKIVEKTTAQFDRVFDTKVLGLRALLDATAKDPITTLCLFSSIAARTGNLGQCDYAMANDVLNLVACEERARRGASCTVRSIGWGPWDGGMVTPGLKSHFEKMGVPLIPLEVGARMFVDELQKHGDDVTIVIGGPHGDGPLGAGTVPHATVETRVDAASHPWLADHRIGGAPVVPMVLAVEWFLRAAAACRSDLVPTAVRNLKVLRGIKLERFEREGDRFVVSAKQLSNGHGAQLAVELRGEGDVLHYSATVDMAENLATQPKTEPKPALDRWTQPAIYDGKVLFHGPAFHVIRSVDGVSRAGISGTLAGVREAQWPTQSWRSDAAAFDGGLQFALLWSRHVLGGAVLPMALGEFRTYREGLADGPVHCVVHGRKVLDARTIADVSFTDANGHVLAEMIGVETVLRPAETPRTGVASA